jgi:hypothetical protein
MGRHTGLYPARFWERWVFTILLALATPQPAETDMLAQFAAGKLLCTAPDIEHKTCATIDQVIIRDDGTLIDTGETLIPGSQSATLETSSRAEMDDGALCGILDLADVRKGVVRVNGSPLPSSRNASVIARLSSLYSASEGARVCERLSITNGHLIRSANIEGAVDSPPDQSARWITRDEGYRVARR